MCIETFGVIFGSSKRFHDWTYCMQVMILKISLMMSISHFQTHSCLHDINTLATLSMRDH